VLVKIDDLDASSLEALVKDLLRQSGPTLRLLVQTPGSGKTEPRLVTLELPGPPKDSLVCVPRDKNADLPVKASRHPEPSVDGVPENGVAAGGRNNTHNPAAELELLMPPSTCEGGGESLAEMRTQLLDCAREAHTLQAQVAALQSELDRKGRECRAAHELLAAATRQQEMRDMQTAPTAQQAHAREEEEMAAAVKDGEASSAQTQASLEAAPTHAPLCSAPLAGTSKPMPTIDFSARSPEKRRAAAVTEEEEEEEEEDEDLFVFNDTIEGPRAVTEFSTRSPSAGRSRHSSNSGPRNMTSDNVETSDTHVKRDLLKCQKRPINLTHRNMTADNVETSDTDSSGSDADTWQSDKWQSDRQTSASRTSASRTSASRTSASSGAGASSAALLVQASSGALEVQVALLHGQLALQQAELQAARKAQERVAQPAERWAALDALQVLLTCC